MRLTQLLQPAAQLLKAVIQEITGNIEVLSSSLLSHDWSSHRRLVDDLGLGSESVDRVVSELEDGGESLTSRRL